jgi:hypothetical protein
MVQDNNTCKTLCVIPDVAAEEAKFINDRIREDYALNWLVDGLPAAEMKIDLRNNDTFYDMGFNLGNNEGAHQNLPALNNHYEIVLKFVHPAAWLGSICNVVMLDIINQPQTHIALLVFSFGLLGPPVFSLVTSGTDRPAALEAPRIPPRVATYLGLSLSS